MDFFSIIAGISLFFSGATTSPATTTLAVEEATTTRSEIIVEIEAVFPEDKGLAKRIAYCESGLDPEAKNSSSSATGLYQIVHKTWVGHGCEGDKTDYKDNIACARKIYDGKQGLGAWQSSFSCWRKTGIKIQ